MMSGLKVNPPADSDKWGEAMRVGIVCGYGNVVDENQLTYIAGVYRIVLDSSLDILILSGGVSSKNSLQTEAETMGVLLRKKGLIIPFILEQKALTTLHNLKYSKQLIAANGISPQCIIIFCDTVRFLKVFLLCKVVFRGHRYQVVRIHRKEPLSAYLRQFPSILSQLGAARRQTLENRLLAAKTSKVEASEEREHGQPPCRPDPNSPRDDHL